MSVNNIIGFISNTATNLIPKLPKLSRVIDVAQTAIIAAASAYLAWEYYNNMMAEDDSDQEVEQPIQATNIEYQENQKDVSSSQELTLPELVNLIKMKVKFQKLKLIKRQDLIDFLINSKTALEKLIDNNQVQKVLSKPEEQLNKEDIELCFAANLLHEIKYKIDCQKKLLKLDASKEVFIVPEDNNSFNQALARAQKVNSEIENNTDQLQVKKTRKLKSCLKKTNSSEPKKSVKLIHERIRLAEYVIGSEPHKFEVITKGSDKAVQFAENKHAKASLPRRKKIKKLKNKSKPTFRRNKAMSQLRKQQKPRKKADLSHLYQ